MPRLVSEPDAIDAAWLTETLRELGMLASTQSVTEVSSQRIGDGKMGDNIRYEVTYSEAGLDLPPSFVAKLPAVDPIARNSSAAQGSYWREVSFYSEVAPTCQLRTPRAYVALVDDNRADYVILLEDMHPSEVGDQIAGCSAEVAELAVREAAKMHGPLTGAATLEAAEWVVKTDANAAAFGQTMLATMWPGFVERFASAMPAEGQALAERFIHSFATWSTGYDGPRTLVHADYRLENMLFGNHRGGPPIAVVDWQSCSYGLGMADVAYFLGGGLPVEERRACEREIVEIYRKDMAAFGVEMTAEESWQLYRRSSLHGILITVLGSMLSGQDDRGDRMFEAMIGRHTQHALDLDADDFLR